jgi:hypothetical protein
MQMRVWGGELHVQGERQSGGEQVGSKLMP